MAVQHTPGDIDVRPSHVDDPPVERRHWSFTESKLGVKTTEFWVMLVVVAGILVSTFADDDTLARDDGWRFVTIVVAAYIVSRGLAKLGSRQPRRGDD